MKNGRTPIAQNATADQTPAIVPGTYPGAHTLEGRALSRLLIGDSLTHGKWLGEARSMRLAAEILELRQLGWLISTSFVTVPTRDRTADGIRPARIGVYTLDLEQWRQVRFTPEARAFRKAVQLFERQA